MQSKSYYHKSKRSECPSCGSSRGLAEYEDKFYCFACKKVLDKDIEGGYNSLLETPLRDLAPRSGCTSLHFQSSSLKHLTKGTLKESLKDVPVTKQYISTRSISKETYKFYGVEANVEDSSGKPLTLEYPYPTIDGDEETPKKVRRLDRKEFYTSGPMRRPALFGMDKFPAGSAKAITISEGEDDACAIYQMMGAYPSVSVRSSSQALDDCKASYDYINSFDKIYIAFDADEPGTKATQQVAGLFDPNKTYIVDVSAYGYNDPRDYLINGKAKEFSKIWWNAKKYLPKGIVNSFTDIKDILQRNPVNCIAHYPFSTLDEMAHGIREGEITLITAQEKVGKTEIVRAIEHHILKTTDHNIGVIHIEEGEQQAIQGLLKYELGKPVHLPTDTIPVEDQVKAYQSMVGDREERVNFYAHFGSEDPNLILDVVRFMAKGLSCKVIFLDHITMLATGFENDDERKKLDYISTRLSMLVRELGFHLVLVSHVNEQGTTRGSKNISKVADILVHVERDNEAEAIDRRNTTTLTVRGNRFAGTSGPAGFLWFDPMTHTIREKTHNDGLTKEEIEVPF